MLLMRLKGVVGPVMSNTWLWPHPQLNLWRESDIWHDRVCLFKSWLATSYHVGNTIRTNRQQHTYDVALNSPLTSFPVPVVWLRALRMFLPLFPDLQVTPWSLTFNAPLRNHSSPDNRILNVGGELSVSKVTFTSTGWKGSTSQEQATTAATTQTKRDIAILLAWPTVVWPRHTI